MLRCAFPNIPWDGAPVGPDESFNTVVRIDGEPPSFDFEPLDHVALIEKNDWADLSPDRPGLGQPHLLPEGPPRPARDQADGLGAGADRRRRLHADHRPGASLASRPSSTRASSRAIEEETYELPNDDLWLAGTAEVALTSLHSGEIIEGDKLPILYAGSSPCFRREAGSAGKDVRGLLRVHQF